MGHRPGRDLVTSSRDICLFYQNLFPYQILSSSFLHIYLPLFHSFTVIVLVASLVLSSSLLIMGEGSVTRYKALEESLHKLTDQLNQQSISLSKMESIGSTVERHSEALDKSFTLYTDLHKSLSDITHQLARLEKQPLHQPPPP
ncbi:hypothetical protein Tco_1026681 [Tanacetum coccineum]